MISFVSISSFRSRLQSLLKVKRGVYSGVKKEISSAFSDLSMEQIRNNRDMILVDDASVVIKLRLPDKKQHLSKSDDYLNYKTSQEMLEAQLETNQQLRQLRNQINQGNLVNQQIVIGLLSCVNR